MTTIKDNLVNLDSRRSELKNENKFLDIVDKEFDTAKPIPSTVFERIANIKHQALLARQNNEKMEM